MPTDRLRRARLRVRGDIIAFVALFLALAGLSARLSTQQATYARSGCVRSTQDRYVTALKDFADADREYLLASDTANRVLPAGLKRAAVARLPARPQAHYVSAERARRAGTSIMSRTAATDRGRVRFCARAFPMPSLLHP